MQKVPEQAPHHQFLKKGISILYPSLVYQRVLEARGRVAESLLRRESERRALRIGRCDSVDDLPIDCSILLGTHGKARRSIGRGSFAGGAEALTRGLAGSSLL